MFPTVVLPLTLFVFVTVKSGRELVREPARKPLVSEKLPPDEVSVVICPITPVNDNDPPALVSPPLAITNCGISRLDGGGDKGCAARVSLGVTTVGLALAPLEFLRAALWPR